MPTLGKWRKEEQTVKITLSYSEVEANLGYMRSCLSNKGKDLLVNKISLFALHSPSLRASLRAFLS